MKKRILLFVMLLWSFCGFAQVIENTPISNLEAVVYENDSVLLIWDLPETQTNFQTTLSWLQCDTINADAQYGYDSYIANRYDTLDLHNFIGWKLESVSFYKISNWSHYICVWEQKQNEPMHLLYSQIVPEETPMGLNTIALEEILQIEQNTQYWFGLRIKREDYQFGYSFPIGVVQGEGVEGKSNLYLDGNTWYILPYSFQVWLKVSLVDATKENKTLMGTLEDVSVTGYRIYRDGELVKEIPYSFVTYFKDTEYTRSFDVEYCVTALYGDEESEPVCVTAAITGANETASQEKFTISPNPTSGTVRIEGETIAEIKVYNTLGQLMKTVKNTNEINLKGLPKGVYLLNIVDENGVVVVKRIIEQ